MATQTLALTGSCSGPVSITLQASGSANGPTKDQALQRARIQAQTVLDGQMTVVSQNATCPAACPTVDLEQDPDYDSAVPQYAVATDGTGIVDCTIQMARVVTLTCSAATGDGVTPTVSAVTPTGGPVAGGTAVTVTGSGLSVATGVLFGVLQAGDLVILSDTQLTVTSPGASVTGPAAIAIQTADESDGVPTAVTFTYA